VKLNFPPTSRLKMLDAKSHTNLLVRTNALLVLILIRSIKLMVTPSKFTSKKFQAYGLDMTFLPSKSKQHQTWEEIQFTEISRLLMLVEVTQSQ